MNFDIDFGPDHNSIFIIADEKGHDVMLVSRSMDIDDGLFGLYLIHKNCGEVIGVDVP